MRLSDNLIAESSVNLAPFIDYTLLKPIVSLDDIEFLCKTAGVRKYKSICINGSWVSLVKSAFPQLTVCCVVDFPLGAQSISSKVFEITSSLLSGADELDIVLNLSSIKEKKFSVLSRDIKTMLLAAHNVVVNKPGINRKPLVVKFIIETGYLSDNEMIDVSKLIRDAYYTDRHEHEKVVECFVKTCTGFGPRGVEHNDIKNIKFGIGDNSIGIKASGGISTIDTVSLLLTLGATRIGTSTDILNQNLVKNIL